MAASDDEKDGTDTPEARRPVDLEYVEPVVEQALAPVRSEKPFEEGKHIDVEAEEVESQDDEKKDEFGKSELRRMQSNRTQTTTTSVATDDAIADAQPQVPRKRTWGEKLNPLKRKQVPPAPPERKPSREKAAGFFSKLTFQWIAPLMSVGYQRSLEVNDVWWVNPDREVDVLSEKLLASLKKRKEAGSKRPLLMALYDTFKKEFLMGGACNLTAAMMQVLSPFTLKYLIDFAGLAYYDRLHGRPEPAISHGIGLILGITCMQVIQSLCTNHFIYRGEAFVDKVSCVRVCLPLPFSMVESPLFVVEDCINAPLCNNGI